MPDWIDESQEWQAKLLGAQISEATASSRLPPAFICEDCGEDIPEARRRLVMGVQRCIHCQERVEKNARHFRTR
ncbi:conjugal transfer protein TraR [Enterobacterales bacterium]|nr:conjugal transfer protein TraR [Enterobacterales bacterium]